MIVKYHGNLRMVNLINILKLFRNLSVFTRDRGQNKEADRQMSLNNK